MTDNPSNQVRPGRRRFLAKLGAVGLGVSVATFAHSAPASASSCGCCGLKHCPPNTTWTYCNSHASYIWRCLAPYPNRTECLCCETAGNAQSAYTCYHD
jgi:hypothetical protein